MLQDTNVTKCLSNKTSKDKNISRHKTINGTYLVHVLYRDTMASTIWHGMDHTFLWRQSFAKNPFVDTGGGGGGQGCLNYYTPTQSSVD